MSDTDSITREEALAALNDPEKGSLAVLKAVGKTKDQYARQLEAGVKTLKAKNPFEQACAEVAVKDFIEDRKESGMDVPDDLAVVLTGT
ncbi:MAG: hypothetical protein LBW85_00515 [Deltaproteobacteria bacterium]|jgi:hypothetical protein|nr:hypothetical protein [Deltaproteobacteria bacterium]